MLAVLELGLALLVAAVLLAAYALHRLAQSGREARRGRLVSVDAGPRRAELLRSEGWRLSGRPDEIRALPDGRWVPVEWKTRPAPRRGPLPSHRVQLLAYCLLCEARTGRAPPYGLLRYGDGREFRVAWDAAARAELWGIRQAMARPYDGRHAASAAKCGGCRWRPVCDVRAVP